MTLLRNRFKKKLIPQGKWKQLNDHLKNALTNIYRLLILMNKYSTIVRNNVFLCRHRQNLQGCKIQIVVYERENCRHPNWNSINKIRTNRVNNILTTSLITIRV